MIHAYTGNGSKKYTNAKSVTLENVKKGKVSLEKGKTFKIKAKVNNIQKNKQLMPKSHVATLRYLSSDKKGATVSKSGKITASARTSGQKAARTYQYVRKHLVSNSILVISI